MPVRKKDGKWYWGGQGPFNSKQKAEEVAQAAYSSGYTKKGWLTNPRGSTDNDKHKDAAEEERQQGFRYRKAMGSPSGGWGQGGRQEGTKPTIPRSKNRKVKKGVSFGSTGDSQGDSLKRGAYWDQEVDNKKTGHKKDEHEESAVQKFLKYDQARSINHPSYPPTHGGLLGPKRIDWKKKRKTPIDNTQPTEFVEKNVQKQVDLFEMPDFWLSKFIDINRQRGLAYILKQSEDEEEEIDPSPEPDEPQEDYELIDEDDEQDVDASAGVIQWDTETMGPLPPDRIPIRDVSQAPKGVRIIEGPRGGFYYLEGQGDTASTTSETNRHAANFDRIRDSLQSEIVKFETRDKAVNDMMNKHMERIEAEHGLSDDGSDEYVDKLTDAAMNDKAYMTFLKAQSVLDQEKRDFYEKQRKPMAEAMDSLFKSFADDPQIEGLPVHINPDVTLQAGADFAQTFVKHVQDLSHMDFMVEMHNVPVPDPEKDYKEMTIMHVRGVEILSEFTPHLLAADKGKKYIDPDLTLDARQTLKDIADGLINDPNTGKPMTRDRLAYYDRIHRSLDYHEAYMAVQMTNNLDRKHLGGYYLSNENVLAVNPHHVVDLFGSDRQKFMDSMQTVSHELLHSGSHGETGRDRVNILKTMGEEMDNIRYSSDVTTSLYSNDGGAVEHSKEGLDYKEFIEECPIELMSHIVLEDKYGISKKPKNREEAANLALETKQMGYENVVPMFAKWMLAKHNDSPKAARKDMVAFLNTKDPSKLQEEYINFSAVNALSHKAATDDKNLDHRHTQNFMSAFGSIDLDKYEKGELKRMKPGATTEERPDTIDMPDYIKYNKEALSKQTASMEDVKWLLYGERD